MLRHLSIVFCIACFWGSLRASPPELTVYIRDSFYEHWHERLQAAFPGKMRFIRLSGSALMGRLALEGAGTKADIVLGVDSCYGEILKEKGCVASNTVDPTSYDLPVPWDRDFVPFSYGYLGLLYDTRTSFRLPTDWEDFLSLPEKSLLVASPLTSATGLVFWHRMAQQSFNKQAFWSRIRATPKGLAQAFGLFATKQAPLVLAYTTSLAHRQEIYQNTHIKALIFDKHPFLAYMAFRTPRGATHPLSNTFLELLVSDALQSRVFEVDHLYPVTAKGRAQAGLSHNEPKPCVPVANFTKAQQDQLLARWQRLSS